MHYAADQVLSNQFLSSILPIVRCVKVFNFFNITNLRFNKYVLLISTFNQAVCTDQCLAILRALQLL